MPKNKNKPDEDLKKVKGKVYYSESEKTFYELDGDVQKPVEDKEKIKKEVFESVGSFSNWLKEIFEVKDSKKDDESFLPFMD